MHAKRIAVAALAGFLICHTPGCQHGDPPHQPDPGQDVEASVGLFGLRRDYAVGRSPSSVAVGDFDADGRQDLAVANPLEGTVSILLGNGNGTFLDRATVALSGTGNTVIAIGDFDGDDRVDFAAPVDRDAISIQLGNGAGTFKAGIAHSENASWLATDDFDGDGRLDLAVVQRDWIQVLILLGRGNGTFRTGQRIRISVGELIAVAVGDFDHDGRPDLAVTDHYYSDVLIFLARGNGAFGAPRRFDVGRRPTNLVVADFNRDGSLDLATPNDLSYTEGVSLLMGNGDGTFQPLRSIPTSPIDRAIALTTGDFNGDGLADVATTNGEDRVAVYLGNGDGTFAAPLRDWTGQAPSLPAAGRFNADMRDDLAVPNQDDVPGTVSIFNTR